MEILEWLLAWLLYLGDMLIGPVASVITLIGVVQLVFAGAAVITVLLTVYMRPVKTRKQQATILISALAAFIICCMTLLLYLKSLKGVL